MASHSHAPTVQKITLHAIYLFMLLGALVRHPAYAYPTASGDKRELRPVSRMSKRAFDRLDVSPFDFDIAKRFADAEDSYYYYPYDASRVKRAFDRLEDSGFFGLQRRRRAFDRVDHSFFMSSKRAAGPVADVWDGESQFHVPEEVEVQRSPQKRPFDRLESGWAAFQLAKRGTPGDRLSIEDLLEKYPATLGM